VRRTPEPWWADIKEKCVRKRNEESDSKVKNLWTEAIAAYEHLIWCDKKHNIYYLDDRPMCEEVV